MTVIEDILTLSRKHWKNHFMVYRLVNTSCLSCSSTNTHQQVIIKTKLTLVTLMTLCGVGSPTKCCFSLGIVFFRMRSWCSWKRISFGKPGTKNPEVVTRILRSSSSGPAELKRGWTSYRAWRASVQTAV